MKGQRCATCRKKVESQIRTIFGRPGFSECTPLPAMDNDADKIIATAHQLAEGSGREFEECLKEILEDQCRQAKEWRDGLS